MATYDQILPVLRESRALLYEEVLAAQAKGDLSRVMVLADDIADLTSAIGTILPDFP